MDKPEQLPEGKLIAAALKRSGLSARKAAELIGISDGRWGQIVRGYQTMGGGVYAPVKGPADTLARMAHVVGVRPDELRDAGRPDAAAYLRRHLAAQGAPPNEQQAPADDLVKVAHELLEQGRRLEELGRRMLGDAATETADQARDIG